MWNKVVELEQKNEEYRWSLDRQKEMQENAMSQFAEISQASESLLQAKTDLETELAEVKQNLADFRNWSETEYNKMEEQYRELLSVKDTEIADLNTKVWESNSKLWETPSEDVIEERLWKERETMLWRFDEEVASWVTEARDMMQVRIDELEKEN